jgi:IS5 family transposase
MKPQKSKYNPQMDLFKIELSRIVDKKHPLGKLSGQMNWQAFDERFEAYFSEEGRPAIATRLMVSLHYLKYTYNLSDEEVVRRWVENPYWQYFSGRQHFEYGAPIDPSSMTRWRKRIGTEGAEALLKQTITTGIEQGQIKRSHCERVNVDTTVQTKDIRFPTDARLYNRMREKLVKSAQREGLELRQSYVRIGKRSLQRQQNYAHARQMKRAKRETRRLKTMLGRVIRDIERKMTESHEELQTQLVLGKQLMEQERNSKDKIYSIHEPQVQCIAKGKVHQRYEFGCKVGFVVSAKGNWVLGAQAFEDNPYDGHTLGENIEQAEKLTDISITQATVDQGYRGHGVEDKKVLIVPRRKNKASKTIRRWWRRRNAIEPIIGHQKSEHRLHRNHLAGELGDSMNVLLSACGFNIKKLLRAFWLWIRNMLERLLGRNFQENFS